MIPINSTKTLGAYSNQNIVLRLPEGKTLRDIKWLSVWCREFKVNFGDLLIPRNLAVPSPVEIPALSRLAHGVSSSPITIVDAQTFLIPNFQYDGQGPAGYWWATRGQRQGPKGLINFSAFKKLKILIIRKSKDLFFCKRTSTKRRKRKSRTIKKIYGRNSCHIIT